MLHDNLTKFSTNWSTFA